MPLFIILNYGNFLSIFQKNWNLFFYSYLQLHHFVFELQSNTLMLEVIIHQQVQNLVLTVIKNRNLKSLKIYHSFLSLHIWNQSRYEQSACDIYYITNQAYFILTKKWGNNIWWRLNPYYIQICKNVWVSAFLSFSSNMN